MAVPGRVLMNRPDTSNKNDLKGDRCVRTQTRRVLTLRKTRKIALQNCDSKNSKFAIRNNSKFKDVVIRAIRATWLDTNFTNLHEFKNRRRVVKRLVHMAVHPRMRQSPRTKVLSARQGRARRDIHAAPPNISKQVRALKSFKH